MLKDHDINCKVCGKLLARQFVDLENPLAQLSEMVCGSKDGTPTRCQLEDAKRYQLLKQMGAANA